MKQNMLNVKEKKWLQSVIKIQESKKSHLVEEIKKVFSEEVAF